MANTTHMNVWAICADVKINTIKYPGVRLSIMKWNNDLHIVSGMDFTSSDHIFVITGDGEIRLNVDEVKAVVIEKNP